MLDLAFFLVCVLKNNVTSIGLAHFASEATGLLEFDINQRCWINTLVTMCIYVTRVLHRGEVVASTQGARIRPVELVARASLPEVNEDVMAVLVGDHLDQSGLRDDSSPNSGKSARAEVWLYREASRYHWSGLETTSIGIPQ